MSAERGQFNSKIGFILAAAGSAVGLGNIWKFPFEVADGGGAAFLIIYLICCFVICYPVMVSEIAIGRKTNKNPVGAFSALGFPSWSKLGLLGVICGVMILSFYNVVAAWAFGYFLEILMGNWSVTKDFGSFVNNIELIMTFSILFMFLTAFIVSKGVQAGIEKASKIMMPSLFILLIILVIYSFTLPYAMEGVKFYLVPDFSEINLEVIYGAMGQAFFSLSLGMGALITYGSYVGKKDNIPFSAAAVTISDVSVAFLAGLMMFPIVAYMKGGDMTNVSGGAGLIFVTLPGVFEAMGPIIGRLVGSLFFLLLSFAALTSTVSLLEVPSAYLVDEKKMNRKNAVWLSAIFIFVVGVPSMLSQGKVDWLSQFVFYANQSNATDFLTFVADIFGEALLLLGGALIAFFAAYRWKTEEMDKELALGNENYLSGLSQKWIGFCVKYISPFVISLVFIIFILNKFFGLSIFN